MSRTLTTLATVSLAVLVPTAAVAAATPTPAPKLATTLSTAVTSSTCSVTWGSLPKGSSRSSSAVSYTHLDVYTRQLRTMVRLHAPEALTGAADPVA